MDSLRLDLTKFSEDDLTELNRRIVERLQLLRSANGLVQLARFSVGMIVEFETDDGRTISGTVARLKSTDCDRGDRSRTLAGQPLALASCSRAAGYRDAIGPRCCAATATEVAIVQRKYRSCRSRLLTAGFRLAM